MIPQNIKKQIKEVEKLRVINSVATYQFDVKNNILYIPITETNFSHLFSECCFRKIELCVDNLVEFAEGMFNDCCNLQDIIFTKKLNLSNVTVLSGLFNECPSLISFDFKDIILSNKLRQTQFMFSECEQLREINFGDNFYSENIISIKCMFNNCKRLEKINWAKCQSFNNLEFMQSAFIDCEKLEQLDLRGVNFSNIKNLMGALCAVNPKLNVLVNNTLTKEIEKQLIAVPGFIPV